MKYLTKILLWGFLLIVPTIFLDLIPCLGNSNISCYAQSELFYRYTGPSSMRLYGVVVGNDSAMYAVGGDAAAVGKDGFITRILPDGSYDQFISFKSIFVGPGVDIDNEGNIFIAGGNNILKISKDKKIDTLMTGFNGAFDIKLDLNRNMYIADHKENKIYKVTPSLEKILFIDNHTPTGSFILGGLDFDKEYKNLYSIAVSKRELRKYPMNEDGTAGEPEIIYTKTPEFYSFDVDEEGNTFSTDFSKGEFLKITKEGELVYLTNNSKLNHPMGFRLGRPGFHENSVFVADAAGIKKINLMDSPTGLNYDTNKPEGHCLFPNYPNPFNPETLISYLLPEGVRIDIDIYNLAGQRIATLFEGIKSPGTYKIAWNAKDFSSGIYLCRIIATGIFTGNNTFQETQKLILLK
jgi:hypothetical protein